MTNNRLYRKRQQQFYGAACDDGFVDVWKHRCNTDLSLCQIQNNSR